MFFAKLATAAPEGPAARYGLEKDKRPRYPQELRDELFAAILIDDEIDPQIQLPNRIELRYEPYQLSNCFALAVDLWRDALNRAELCDIIYPVVAGGDFTDESRVRWKHARAKFKHLRYAHALYGVRHRSPTLLDTMTISMGKIQDACRNRHRAAILQEAAILRVLLTRPLLWRLVAQAERLTPTTSAQFGDLLAGDVVALKRLVASERVTGRELHGARKRIGRQVSFFDTLRTLEPTPDRFRTSRALSAINGLMGGLHDRLVEGKMRKPSSYDEPFVLSEDIRDRIKALLPCYEGAMSARA